MKHVLILFAVMMVLVPTVYAEDDKWIDGIKFRYGGLTFSPDLSHPSMGSSEVDNRIIVNSSLPNSLIPVALVLPETSMNSFSFRGGIFEISNESYDDLAPYGFESSTHLRQSPESRDWLVSSFFNDDDKSYISGKDLWALSADAEMKSLFFGYYWGLFIPIGKNHRFLKTGFGISTSYSELNLKLNLCSEYRIIERTIPDDGGQNYIEGKCEGKYEIDSIRKIGWINDLVLHINLWERVTEDSIFSFYKWTFNQSSFRSNLSFSKHAKQESLTFSPRFYWMEVFTYTYRF